ncbi:ead/Ea22-like family protein [Salmonella enterica subsp. enterica serovar Virchow]|uniref:Ead/Ea22-like family protein n=1 Tax=Salmonella virchow TaxID=48409 RepID=A0A5X7IXE8_SALVI|nr:ead/Ea22-like family protein [Salmonella enterica subsp. enterica serovar Virchow]EBP3215067.1 ead/Ea22-like family protein [Salmonella enterica subsp. arizonae]ECI8200755.1 ead/Ea22-like family protein [Salmonella enterica subsp. enterica]EDZ8254783.1 ead/Ea22-like family protein [Salmonella enterica]EBR0187222.1 ead/Ea22-like family protein [Salmonella enterica subsp. enterica serovar Virchow]
MTIDKQALRQLAERATKGPWRAFSDIGTETYAIHTRRDKRCGNVIKWAGFDCQKNAKANAEFIAAANPATVLALLDELEHYKSREERVTKLVMDNSTSWDALYKKLEAAEKHIAELEARSVILPEPISVLHRRDFTDAHRAIYAYPEAEVNAALAAAGIKVKE